MLVLFKVRIVNVQKVIQVPRSRIKGLDTISLINQILTNAPCEDPSPDSTEQEIPDLHP